jgi:hypothetical protein
MKLRNFLKCLPFMAAVPTPEVGAFGIKRSQIDALVPNSKPEFFSVIFCVDQIDRHPMESIGWCCSRIQELGYVVCSVSTDDLMTDNKGDTIRNYRKNKMKITFRKTT